MERREGRSTTCFVFVFLLPNVVAVVASYLVVITVVWFDCGGGVGSDFSKIMLETHGFGCKNLARGS